MKSNLRKPLLSFVLFLVVIQGVFINGAFANSVQFDIVHSPPPNGIALPSSRLFPVPFPFPNPNPVHDTFSTLVLNQRGELLDKTGKILMTSVSDFSDRHEYGLAKNIRTIFALKTDGSLFAESFNMYYTGPGGQLFLADIPTDHFARIMDGVVTIRNTQFANPGSTTDTLYVQRTNGDLLASLPQGGFATIMNSVTAISVARNPALNSVTLYVQRTNGDLLASLPQGGFVRIMDNVSSIATVGRPYGQGPVSVTGEGTLYVLKDNNDLLASLPQGGFAPIMDGVTAFGVGLANRICVLRSNGTLLISKSGGGFAQVLDGVSAVALGSSGYGVTMYLLKMNGDLYAANPNDFSDKTNVLKFVQILNGVVSFSISSTGTLYVLNQNGALFASLAKGGFVQILDGVATFSVSNGGLFAQKSDTLLASVPGGFAQIEHGVKSFAFTPQGKLEVLKTDGVMLQSLPQGGWELAALGIKSLMQSPTGSLFAIQ